MAASTEHCSAMRPPLFLRAIRLVYFITSLNKCAKSRQQVENPLLSSRGRISKDVVYSAIERRVSKSQLRPSRDATLCDTRDALVAQHVNTEMLLQDIDSHTRTSRGPATCVASSSELLVEAKPSLARISSDAHRARELQDTKLRLESLHRLKQDAKTLDTSNQDAGATKDLQDPTFVANLEHLLLRHLQALLNLITITIWTYLSLVACVAHQLFGDRWYSEWADRRRLLSTKMPWNIKPSLVVLWGVCWMFAMNRDNIKVPRTVFFPEILTLFNDDNNQGNDLAYPLLEQTFEHQPHRTDVQAANSYFPSVGQQQQASRPRHDSPNANPGAAFGATSTTYADDFPDLPFNLAPDAGTPYGNDFSNAPGTYGSHTPHAHASQNFSPRDVSYTDNTGLDATFPGHLTPRTHARPPPQYNSNVPRLELQVPSVPQFTLQSPSAQSARPFTFSPEDIRYSLQQSFPENPYADFQMHPTVPQYPPSPASDYSNKGSDMSPFAHGDSIVSRTQTGTPSGKSSVSDHTPGSGGRTEQTPPKDQDGHLYCDHDECQNLASVPQFNRKCEWRKHMDKHTRPYTCKEPECAKLQGFTYSGGLLRHEREVHGKQGGPKEELHCPHSHCKRSTGKGFTRRENLNEHLRRVHTDDRPVVGESGEPALKKGKRKRDLEGEGDEAEAGDGGVKAEFKRLRSENEALRREMEALKAMFQESTAARNLSRT